jgi:hypothetical protein
MVMAILKPVWHIGKVEEGLVESTADTGRRTRETGFCVLSSLATHCLHRLIDDEFVARFSKYPATQTRERCV